MIELRPYQNDAIKSLRDSIRAGNNRLILCSPTGSGKTVIFSWMAKSSVDRGKSVLIVSDRVELMKQSGGALDKMGVMPFEIRSGHTPRRFDGQIYTAMVETLARRMNDARYQRLVESFNLIILDEAHKQAFNKLFPHIAESTVVIGATATPYRSGKQKALSEFYQDLIEVTDIPTLIRDGYLSKPLSFGVPVDLSGVKMRGGEFEESSMANAYSQNRVYDGVIDNYNRICPGKKALAFASNIASSQELTSKLIDAGINAQHLDSTMTPYERVKILSWFRREPDAVLSNVGILTTGFDCPEIEAIILYRATTSLPLFLQMCGRGSRVAEGKDTFFILDFGNNITGRKDSHGYWQWEREWSLEKPKKKKQGAAPVKNCGECFAIVPVRACSCEFCGFEFPVSEREEKERVVAELQLLEPKQLRRKAMGASIEEKAEMAKAGLIKPFWVLHTILDREEAKRFVKLMGWKKGWWYHNEKRFPNLQKQEAV